jgi:hypothetical protein
MAFFEPGLCVVCAIFEAWDILSETQECAVPAAARYYAVNMLLTGPCFSGWLGIKELLARFGDQGLGRNGGPKRRGDAGRLSCPSMEQRYDKAPTRVCELSSTIGQRPQRLFVNRQRLFGPRSNEAVRHPH